MVFFFIRIVEGLGVSGLDGFIFLGVKVYGLDGLEGLVGLESLDGLLGLVNQ